MRNMITSNNIQVCKNKNLANGKLKKLGNDVTLECVNPKPNRELLKAIKEEDFLRGKVHAKSYTNMYKMLDDLKKLMSI